MGVISRPLSGAAELVALTGEGFLSTVGWTSMPQLLPELASCPSTPSVLKYTPLLVRNSTTEPPSFVYLADATLQQSAGEYTHVILVLTSQYLIVLKVADCEVLDGVGVKELKLVEDVEDDTRLTVSRMNRNKTETEASSFASPAFFPTSHHHIRTLPDPPPTLPLHTSTNQNSALSSNQSAGLSSHSSDTALPVEGVEGHVIYMDAKCKRCLVRLVRR
ncbi:hypothetical protein WDU94_002139 [Cyamophila willieti]